jgi:hypothetical protein
VFLREKEREGIEREREKYLCGDVIIVFVREY